MTQTIWTIGRDAAYPQDIGNVGPDVVVAGYFGGPNAYHVWQPSDWVQFRLNPKLPIWVAGYNGEEEASKALPLLGQLGVRRGSPIVVDMETRVDKSYLLAFGQVVQRDGYLVMVYGSASTVFGNPQLNGYWVADWTNTEHMYQRPDGNSVGIRGTQYAEAPNRDTSAWKPWIVREFWR